MSVVVPAGAEESTTASTIAIPFRPSHPLRLCSKLFVKAMTTSSSLDIDTKIKHYIYHKYSKYLVTYMDPMPNKEKKNSNMSIESLLIYYALNIRILSCVHIQRVCTFVGGAGGYAAVEKSMGG